MNWLAWLPMALAAGSGIAPAGARAAELTTVPMQGPMVHVALGYDAGGNALYVHVDPTIPQLTPLEVSHPGDTFAPGDPWYESLDPSRRALAFNRQYGFVVDAASDLLPLDTGIWIRHVAGDPELQFFRYRSSAPKAWEPILGTAGSSPVLTWSMTMFHPAVAAPPRSENRGATFEAFLADVNSGEPVAGTTPVQFTLTWTSVPSGRPELAIRQAIAISWPVAATDYVLESSPSVEQPNWTVVTNAPVFWEGQQTVILGPDAAHLYFRLRRSP